MVAHVHGRLTVKKTALRFSTGIELLNILCILEALRYTIENARTSACLDELERIYNYCVECFTAIVTLIVLYILEAFTTDNVLNFLRADGNVERVVLRTTGIDFAVRPRG